ncbi:antibiotic biosynthesis monooxygenase [Microvirga sp. 2MCAF38]|uniref:antibiotic biosynthesis monooxygenase family protein n=1 Tax=Microvirga sp. 2MCAF38 TaxID=3232989 RepID=UPI003F9B36DE
MNASLNIVRGLRTACISLAFLAFSQQLTLTSARAQEAPVRPASQATAGEEQTSMRVVLVEWRIKKGREQEFLDYWSTRATIADRSGLIGEFLSRVEDRKQFPWMVWGLDHRWTTYVNVGFWRDGEDFQEQIGRFIDNSKPPQVFEATKRRRVFVAPERWRIGATPFMTADHPDVR